MLVGDLLGQYAVHYVIKSIGLLTFFSVLHRAILLFICRKTERRSHITNTPKCIIHDYAAHI